MQNRFEVRRTALAAALSTALGLGALLASTAAHAAAWANTATQATPLKHISLIAPMLSGAPMHVTVGLNLRNKAQLDAFVAQVGKPGSPSFGKMLTPQQFLDQYAPTKAQSDAVLAYLGQAGFTNLVLSANHMS
ncbi:MAG: protease pro-enzyme activation domain-containing protein, partial [Nevskiales bacterium]